MFILILIYEQGMRRWYTHDSPNRCQRLCVIAEHGQFIISLSTTFQNFCLFSLGCTACIEIDDVDPTEDKV